MPTSDLLINNKINNNTLNNREEWLFATFLFLLSAPYFVWERMYLYWISAFFFLAISIKHLRFKKNDIAIPIIILILCFYFQLKVVYNGRIANINAIILVLFTTITLIPFFFLKSSSWYSIFKKYLLIFSITLIPSIIQYSFSFFLNTGFSSNVIDTCPLNPGRSYNQFLFYVSLRQFGDFWNFGDLYRFFSYYDEPGVLGNVAMVLMYVEGYNLKRWYNIPIFIAGILSFSLLFYIATLLYILLFGKVKVKLIVGLIVFLMIMYAYNNSILYEYVFKRFEIVDGKLVGDNRANKVFSDWFENIKLEEYFFLGYEVGKKVEYAASYLYTMVLFGVIPNLLFFVLIINRAYKKLGLNKYFLLYSVIPFMIWYQRPFVWMPLYYFLMFVPLYCFYEQKNQKKLHNE